MNQNRLCRDEGLGLIGFRFGISGLEFGLVGWMVCDLRG